VSTVAALLELYVLAIGKFRPSQTVCVIAPSRKIDQYSYHYKKMLKRRILDKRKELTDDLHLITKVEDKLQAL
jgi:hypothetical protein